MTESKDIASLMFSGYRAESKLDDAMLDADFPGWERTSCDEYDNSLELYEVGNDARLTEKQQQVIWDAGFSLLFVNHKDGWETHYSTTRKYNGWRKRQKDGVIEVEEFPDSWNTNMLKENGGNVIVINKEKEDG